MRRVMLEGFECLVHQENIKCDDKVFMSYRGDSITTKQTKDSLDSLINNISLSVDVISIIDDRKEKYSTALTVIKAMRLLFEGRNIPNFGKEKIKITIDVLKEVMLSLESNPMEREKIKAASLFTKMLIG